MPIELIPKVFVIGLFTPPPGIPGGVQVSLDKINRIWSEVTPTYPYRQFQMTPDGAARAPHHHIHPIAHAST